MSEEGKRLEPKRSTREAHPAVIVGRLGSQMLEGDGDSTKEHRVADARELSRWVRTDGGAPRSQTVRLERALSVGVGGTESDSGTV